MRARIPTVVLTCALLLAAQACGSGGKMPESKPISAEQLAAAIAAGDRPFVLDVRSQAEFSQGHIPGAINIPHDEVATRLGELPTDRESEIVVHCQSGRRARAAESILKDAGFTHVRDLSGHMSGWRAGNHPVE